MGKDTDFPHIEIVEAEPVDETPTAESLGLDLPDDPSEALEVVLKALAQSREEADGYLDDLRRVAADFENFRKRTHRELSAMVERASERVVREMLPVLDSFDAALTVEARSDGERQLLVGMRNTYEQLLDVLAKEGLAPIDTWDQPFDPTFHEAVMTTDDGDGPLMVSQELRRGYTLRDKVLRAALVGVAPAAASEPTAEDDTPEDQ
ncbi:MAG: nucleotide exchange factor GrpE [Acidimicrobiia bacterium]